MAVADLVALLAVGVAGCGGGGDESSIDSGKSEFVAAANAICAKTGDEISASAAKLNGAGGRRVLKFLTDVTLPKLERQYHQIEALSPPESDQDEISAFVAAGEKAVEKSKQDPQQLLVPEGGSTPFDEPNKLATNYGLDQCGG